jgi:hypothetical protein
MRLKPISTGSDKTAAPKESILLYYFIAGSAYLISIFGEYGTKTL